MRYIGSHVYNDDRLERVEHLYTKRYKNKATAPQNLANVAPPKAARRVKILFFFYADYAWRIYFLRHVTLLAIVIGHRATPKNVAVKDKFFPAFISRRGAALRSLQCSPLQCRPCYDKLYSLYFFNAQSGVP